MDTIEFIEKYCLINGKPVKLKEYQKEFIRWLEYKKTKYNNILYYWSNY